MSAGMLSDPDVSLLTDLLTVVQDPILLVDAGGRVQAWSSGASQLLDLPPDAHGCLINDWVPDWDVMWLEWPSATQQSIKPLPVATRAGMQVMQLRLQRLSRHGVPCWALQLLMPEAHTAQALNRSILSSANFAIIATDPEGLIHTFNPSAERLLGYTAAEVVGQMTPAPFHDPGEVVERARMLSEELGQTILPGFDSFVAKTRSTRTADERIWTYVRKDGSRLPVLLSVTALSDASDNIIGYLGIAFDVTRTQTIEAELQRARNFLNSMIEELPNGVFVKSGRPEDFGKVFLWNKACAQTLGIPSAKIIGGYEREHYPPELAASFLEKDRQVFECGVETLPVQQMLSHTGQELLLSITKIPIYDEVNQPLYMLGVVTDITHSERTLRALAEREAEMRKLAVVASRTDNAVVITDAAGRVEWVNAAFTRISGYALDEVRGRKPGDVLQGPGTEPVTVEYMRRRLAHGKGFTVEILNYHKSGHPYWLSMDVQAVRDERQQLIQYVAVQRDITAQKDSEARMLLQNRLLGAVRFGLTLYIAEQDPRRVFQLLLNEMLVCTESAYGGMLAMQGEGPGPLVEAGSLPALGDTVSMVNHLLDASRRSRGPVSLNWPPGARNSQPVLALPCFALDTLLGLIVLAGRPEGYNDDLLELIQPVVVSVTSVIQAVRHEQERQNLLDELAQFRQWLDSTLDMICCYDPQQSRLTYVNQGMRERLGYLEHELDQLPFDVLLDPAEQLVFQQKLALCLSGQHRALQFETVFLTASRDAFPVEILLQLNHDHLSRPLFVSIARDVSERRKMERMKSEFISTVSHELRTPLTSIVGSLSLLTAGAMGGLPQPAMELLGIAQRNGQRLLALISDILDIEKMESGRLRLQCELCDLMPLLQQSLDNNTGYADSFGVSIQAGGAWLPIKVWADPGRLAQVLNNLISNAIKFSPKGDRVLVYMQQQGARVTIVVEDRGSGIPEAFRSRIFQKFSQADASDTRLKGGTGLGLSISKMLIEQMQGEIGFDSQTGLTRFFFSLPVTETQEGMSI